MSGGLAWEGCAITLSIKGRHFSARHMPYGENSEEDDLSFSPDKLRECLAWKDFVGWFRFFLCSNMNVVGKVSVPVIEQIVLNAKFLLEFFLRKDLGGRVVKGVSEI